MKDKLFNSHGFTLIEIIVSLVIMGILSIIAGTGIVAGLNGWMTARENVHLTQKAQLALQRMSREFLEHTDILGINNDVPYVVLRTNTGTSLAIAKAGSTLKLIDSPASGTLTQGEIDSGDILTDRVDGLTIDYLKGNEAWSGNDIRELSTIRVELSLNRIDNIAETLMFSAIIHPRNNANYGGASSTNQPILPAGTPYCFIGTISPHTLKNPFWDVDHLTQTMAACQILTIVTTLVILIGVGLLLICLNASSAKIVSNRKGAALIGLISMLMVFSVLGTAIVPFVSTSQFQQISANFSHRAYFLAESGYRFAASQYLNAGSPSQKDTILADLNGKTYALQGDDGTFSFEIDSNYFIVKQDPSGTQQLITSTVGQPPEAAAFSGGGKLKINDAFFTYNSASFPGDDVVFSMSEVLPSIPAGTSVRPSALAGSAQVISNGDNIGIKTGSASLFPERNGEFLLNGETYSYRVYDDGANQLINIININDPYMTGAVVSEDDDIVLNKFVKLHATGVFGQGEMQTLRTVVYHIPLPEQDNPFQKKTFHDTMETLDNWTVETGGAQPEIMDDPEAPGNKVMDIKGDTILRFDDDNPVLGTPEYNPLYGDVQVKMGFATTSPPPDGGYLPEPVPFHYSAGLLFNFQSSQNGYGLTFQRADNATPGIDEGRVPLNDSQTIVLWQSTNSGQDKQWLAYKAVENTTLFYDNVEYGEGGWSKTENSLWEITANPSDSLTHAWFYDWHITGTAADRELTSPDMVLCDYDKATLTFQSWHETRDQGVYVNSGGEKTVEMSNDGGNTWITIDTVVDPEVDTTGEMGAWQLVEIPLDISSFSQKTVQVRFKVGSPADTDIDHDRWYIDNIRMAGDHFEVNRSTLLVRLREAESMEFTYTGANDFSAGDRIYGVSSDASAFLFDAPIFNDSTHGVLLVENITGTFLLDEDLMANGKTGVITYKGQESKARFIKAYYGTDSGCGTPNTMRTDREKHPNPFGSDTLLWPPDNGQPWTEDQDAYTLIKWDAINAEVASASLIPSIEDPGSIIKSTETQIVTGNDSLALEVSGPGAANVYFDDFGFLTVIGETGNLTFPLQF